MQKIVSVASIAAITILLSSCTFGKTETVQTPVDTKAPVVEVDTTTSGALSNPDFVKEIDEVVNKSLEQAMNASATTASGTQATTVTGSTENSPVATPVAPGAMPPAAPTSTDMTTSQTGASTSATTPKAGE